MSAMCFDSNALEIVDDCRTLHVLDEVLRVGCMLVYVVHTVLENLIIIKLRRLKSKSAGACIIQILQGLRI